MVSFLFNMTILFRNEKEKSTKNKQTNNKKKKPQKVLNALYFCLKRVTTSRKFEYVPVYILFSASVEKKGVECEERSHLSYRERALFRAVFM